MPTKLSRKPDVEAAPIQLPDEYNVEFFQRIKLLQFLAWMRKHKLRLPPDIEEAHRLISEYLMHQREEMVKLAKTRR